MFATGEKRGVILDKGRKLSYPLSSDDEFVAHYRQEYQTVGCFGFAASAANPCGSPMLTDTSVGLSASGEEELNTDNLERGYIRIYRSMRDNPLWKVKREFSDAEAWFDILFEARWKEGVKQVTIGRHVLECGRGQCLNSLETWTERWGWKNKHQTRRFLKFLERMGQIRVESATVTICVTVLNYETYQDWRRDERNTAATHPQQGRNAPATSPQPTESSNQDNPVVLDNLETKYTPVKRERYRSLETYPEQIQKGALWFIEQVKALFPNIRIEANEQAFYLEKLVSVKGADGNQLWTLTQFKEVIAHIHSVNYDNKAFAWARNILSIAKLMKRKDGITYMERLWNEYKLARS